VTLFGKKKRSGDMAQVVEHLPSKCEALSSAPTTKCTHILGRRGGLQYRNKVKESLTLPKSLEDKFLTGRVKFTQDNSLLATTFPSVQQPILHGGFDLLNTTAFNVTRTTGERAFNV
jgi:hypothetical protein